MHQSCTTTTSCSKKREDPFGGVPFFKGSGCSSHRSMAPDTPRFSDSEVIHPGMFEGDRSHGAHCGARVRQQSGVRLNVQRRTDIWQATHSSRESARIERAKAAKRNALDPVRAYLQLNRDRCVKDVADWSVQCALVSYWLLKAGMSSPRARQSGLNFEEAEPHSLRFEVPRRPQE
jgi:hypothetical protein